MESQFIYVVVNYMVRPFLDTQCSPHTHTLTPANTHTHFHTVTHTHTHPTKLTSTQSRTHTHTQPNSLPHSHAHTHTTTLTLAHTYSLTHTRTHVFSFYLWHRSWLRSWLLTEKTVSAHPEKKSKKRQISETRKKIFFASGLLTFHFRNFLFSIFRRSGRLGIKISWNKR